METRGLGEKKASVAFVRKAHWGCGLFPDESLPFRIQLPAWSLDRSLGCGLSAEVPSYLCGIHGAYAQKAFSCQVLLLHEGEHVWNGFPAQGTTSKAAGPREPEAAQALFGLCRPQG